MATISPFRALRYNTDKISDLSKVMTPPYDIISPEQQDAFYEVSPYNVIRLEYGKEFPSDNETNNRYTRAQESLQEMLRNQILIRENRPALYIYEQVFTLPNGETKSYKGIFCLVQLEEFEKKIVLPHEETLSKAKADRFQLMQATGCNFSQIYCLYLDEKREMEQILSRTIKETDASISFTAQDGILQNLWIIEDETWIARAQQFFETKQLFIADGHHRYETALNFRNHKREQGADPQNDLCNYVMMLLVDMDDDGLVVFPTHRMIRNIEQFDEDKLIQQMKSSFAVTKKTNLEEMEQVLQSTEKGFVCYTGQDYYYLLELQDKEAMAERLPHRSSAYQNLDVSILHTLILEPYLGIDPENMAQQTNLVYTRSFEEAIQKVQDKTFQCSFLLNATKVKEIKDVSLANEKMPQKSTYFYPKIITGLVMNQFEE